MTNTNVTFKGKTLATIHEDLKNLVSAYNTREGDMLTKLASDKLAARIKDCVDAYNRCSLLNVYTECKNDAQPFFKFAQIAFYDTISAKIDKDDVASIGKIKQTVMNLDDFYVWMSDHSAGKQVTAAPAMEWKAARSELFKIAGAFLTEETYKGKKVSNNMLKNAVQKWFDGLIFIAGENGQNAFIFKSANIKAVRTAYEMDKDLVTIHVLKSKAWERIQMSMLYATATGKELTYNVGDEADTVKTSILDIDNAKETETEE